MKCKRCGYEWDSRKEKPKSCPNCKRYDWNNDKIIKESKNEGDE